MLIYRLTYCALKIWICLFASWIEAQDNANLCQSASDYTGGKLSGAQYNCDNWLTVLAAQDYFPANRACDVETTNKGDVFRERFIAFDCCGAGGPRCYSELSDFSAVCADPAMFDPDAAVAAGSVTGTNWLSPDWSQAQNCNQAFRLLVTEAFVAGYTDYNPVTGDVAGGEVLRPECDESESFPSYLRYAGMYLASFCCGDAGPACVVDDASFSDVCADAGTFSPTEKMPPAPVPFRRRTCDSAFKMHMAQQLSLNDTYALANMECNISFDGPSPERTARYHEDSLAFTCCGEAGPRCLKNFSAICESAGDYNGGQKIKRLLAPNNIFQPVNTSCDAYLTAMDMLSPHPHAWDCTDLTGFQENAYTNLEEMGLNKDGRNSGQGCCGWGRTVCAAMRATARPDTAVDEGPLEETWSDFKTHVSICVGFWTVLTMLGIMMASCRASWDTERVEKATRTPRQVIESDKYYLIIMGCLSAIVCLLSILRGLGAVYPAWLDDVEAYHSYIYLLEILIVWLHSTARSSEEVVSFAFGRLRTDAFVCMTGIGVRHFNNRNKFSLGYAAAYRTEMVYTLYNQTRTRTQKTFMYASIMKLVAIVLTISSIVRQAESLAGEQWHVTLDSQPLIMTGATAPPMYRWTMTSSFYFIMTCFTTVGFGDMYPRSYFGQFAMVTTACVGLFLSISSALSIATALETGRRGGGNYQNRRRAKHIIVCGGFDLHMLTNFLDEMYHEDHGTDCEDLNTVIMMLPGQSHVRTAMREHLRVNRGLAHRVWLIEGSALKRQDLDRVSYREAAMAYVLPNLTANDPEREDLENVMRALSMSSHTQYVRIVPVLLRQESMSLMLAAGVASKDVVCLDELKLGLMGKSCVIQGFITLTSVLIKNMGVENAGKSGFQDEPWCEHYMHGIANELYEQPLSKAYNGAPFVHVALDVLHRSEGCAYLFGIVEEPLYPGDETITRVFPGRYFRIGTKSDRFTKGIFIAQEKEDIRQCPLGTKFVWSNAGLGEDSAASLNNAKNTALKDSLPGAVPTPTDLSEAGKAVVATYNTADGEALKFHTPGSFGWIKDPWNEEKAKDESVMASMEEAAARRAITTLVPPIDEDMESARKRRDLEKMIGRKVKKFETSSLDAEDQEEAGAGGEDEITKVLNQQNKKLSEQMDREVKIAADKKRMKAEAKTVGRAKRLVKWADERYTMELALQGTVLAKRDQEDDDALWGGPLPPPKPIWGLPKEPPTALLQRGGHIVVLALDSKGEASKGAIGGQLGLQHFAQAARTDKLFPVPIVVVTARAPIDWPKFQHVGQVYLIQCNPISAMNLKRASLRTASAIVIHQDTRVAGSDLSTVDAEAIFACKVVDSVLTEVSRDIPVIVDINIQESAVHLPTNPHERKNQIQLMEQEMKEMNELKELDEDDKIKQAKQEIPHVPFHMENRFLVGQLFSSTLLVSMVANMMYNPTLGSIVREMVHSSVAALPIPDDFKGHSYRQLFEFLMKRKNLLLIALLRRQDEAVDTVVFEDDVEEDEKGAAVKLPDKYLGPENEPAWRRYVLVMPEGNRAVAEHDGLLVFRAPEKKDE